MPRSAFGFTAPDSERITDTGSDSVNEWPMPDMLIVSNGRRSPPQLPLDVFGPWARWIADKAEETSTPPDYVACALLAVASGLIGNARWVSPWTGWAEPPALWVGLVGDPSSGKSPAMAPLVNMIRDMEADLATAFEETHRQYQTDREAAKVAHEVWREEVRRAHKEQTPPPLMPSSAVEPVEPVRARLSVADTTPEALAAILAGQPKGVIMIRDEMAGWLAGLDRYTGGGAERALWLEATGGRPFTVDRIKNSGKPVIIRHLTVSAFGGIQPDRLSSLLFRGDDDGLAARLLLTWPEPVPPARPQRTADDSSAMAALRKLQSLSMESSEESGLAPVKLPLAEEAASLFDHWRTKNYDAIRAASGRLAGHLGKMPGLVLRLALALEYLWWARGAEFDHGNISAISTISAPSPPEVVSLRAIAAAAALATDYFLPMAERAYGDATLPETDRLAATLARWILKERPATVNSRKLHREVRLPGLNTPDAVKTAIDRLIDADWLRSTPNRDGDRGRHKADYAVNPRVWEARRE